MVKWSTSGLRRMRVRRFERWIQTSCPISSGRPRAPPRVTNISPRLPRRTRTTLTGGRARVAAEDGDVPIVAAAGGGDRRAGAAEDDQEVRGGGDAVPRSGRSSRGAGGPLAAARVSARLQSADPRAREGWRRCPRERG